MIASSLPNLEDSGEGQYKTTADSHQPDGGYIQQESCHGICKQMANANMRDNGENWGNAFDERKKGKRESRAGLVNAS
jgi:hypothetical protein